MLHIFRNTSQMRWKYATMRVFKSHKRILCLWLGPVYVTWIPRVWK